MEETVVMKIASENVWQTAAEFYKLASGENYVDADRKSLRDIFELYPDVAESFLHEAVKGGVDTFTICQAVNALVSPAHLPTRFTRLLSTTGEIEYCRNTVGSIIAAEILCDNAAGLRINAQYKAMDLNGHVSSDIPVTLVDDTALQLLSKEEQLEYVRISKSMHQKKLPCSFE